MAELKKKTFKAERYEFVIIPVYKNYSEEKDKETIEKFAKHYGLKKKTP